MLTPLTSNKAAAHGAVLSHVDRSNHRVTTRVARVTCGVVRKANADENDEEHIRRKHLWTKSLNGIWYVPGYFGAKLHKVSPFLSAQREILMKSWFSFKGAKVPEQMEFRDPFAERISNVSDLGMVRVHYVCYRGKLSKPEWLDNDTCTFPFILYFKRDVILTW